MKRADFNGSLVSPVAGAAVVAFSCKRNSGGLRSVPVMNTFCAAPESEARSLRSDDSAQARTAHRRIFHSPHFVLDMEIRFGKGRGCEHNSIHNRKQDL
jgi:hypothetical protein